MPPKPDTQELAIIGLGRMGGNLALHARELGMRVVGYDLHGVSLELMSAGVEPAQDLYALVQKLAPPRRILLYVPVGAGIDALLDTLVPVLERGDTIMDGGNSYWGDSRRRYARLQGHGIAYVDAGTSGGVAGARNGACFMLGGDPEPVAGLEPILRALAVPGGYVRAGGSGAGHFTKLVHNGIEFAMMQAIGEGVELLERFPERIDVGGVLGAFRHGSVIRSWLIDLLAEQYETHHGMDEVPGYVEDTGEVNWLIEDALHFEQPIPVICQSVMQLFASRDGGKRWARAIALMRNAFGGHPFGASPALRELRRTGKLSGQYPDPRK
jgi:6-phosphogluconate dehydrogenase